MVTVNHRGRQYQFPDDSTDQQIEEFLNSPGADEGVEGVKLSPYEQAQMTMPEVRQPMGPFGPIETDPTEAVRQIAGIGAGLLRAPGVVMEPISTAASDLASDVLRRTGIDPSAEPGRNIFDIPTLALPLPPGMRDVLHFVAPEALAGAEKRLGQTVSGFTEPGQALMLPAATQSKMLQALYAATAGAQVPEALAEIPTARTPEELGGALMGAGADIGMAYLMGKGLVKGPEYARQVREAEKVHGDLRPPAVQGEGEMPSERGSQRVQPQTSRLEKEAHVLLKPGEPAQAPDVVEAAERASIDQAAQSNISLGLPGEVVDSSATDPNAPFARQIATVDAEGRIVLNRPKLREWLSGIEPGRQAGALRALFSEEGIHSVARKLFSDDQVTALWNSLTGAEKALVETSYFGKDRAVARPKYTDAQMGHEYLRRSMQRLLRTPLREVAEATSSGRLKEQFIDMAERVIQAVRRLLKSQPTATLDAMLKDIQGKVDAARGSKATAAGPGAYLKFRDDPPHEVDELRFTVQQPEVDPDTGKLVPSGYVQVDGFRSGKNVWSSNPEELRARGIQMPTRDQLMALPKGQYSHFDVAPDSLPAKGMVRLYHGEGGAEGAGMGSLWWTANPRRAASFGENVSFVDVPQDVFDSGTDAVKKTGKYTKGDAIIPDEWILKAKPTLEPVRSEVHDTDFYKRPGEPGAFFKRPKPEAQPEAERVPVTPARIQADMARHLAETARPNFASFVQEAQKKFGKVKPGALRETWPKQVWNRLTQASAAELRSLAKTTGFGRLRKEAARISEPIPAEPPKERPDPEVLESQRARLNVMAAIGQKLIDEAQTGRKAWTRKEVTPEDLADPKVETKQPVWQAFSAADEADPAALGAALTSDSRAFGGAKIRKVIEGKPVSITQKGLPVSVTKRLTAIHNKKTGTVSVVSTYPDGRRGPVLLDPQSPGQTHSPLSSILNRYRVLNSMLLDEPVKDFRQDFKSIRDYEVQFASDVRAAAEKAAGYEEPPLPEQAVPRGTLPSEALTPDEARSIIDQIKGEVREPKSAQDVKLAWEAVAEAPEARQILSGLRKLGRGLMLDNPALTQEQFLDRLAAQIYDNFSQTKTPEDFQRRTMAQAGAEAGPTPGLETKPAEPAQAAQVPAVAAPVEPPGAFLKRDAQERIAEAMRQMPPTTPIQSRFNVAEGIADVASAAKEGWQRALARAEGAGAMMRDLLLGRPRLDTFDRLAYQHEAMKQRGTANARTVRQEALKRFKTEDEREAMNNWLQAQVFDDPPTTLKEWAKAAEDKAAASKGFIERQYWTRIARRYQDALKLNPDQLAAARKVEEAYRALGDELQKSGVLHDVLEDYMGPHLVDAASTDPAINTFRAQLTAGRLSTNFRYAMKRMFETEFALEMAGKKLRTKDIFAKLTTYLEQSEHVKANRWMVKQLKDGETAAKEPWIDFRAVRVLPAGQAGDALLIKPSRNPGNPGQYVKIDHPALRGWRWAAKDEAGRDVFVEGDAWVHRDIYPRLRNILKRSALYNLPGVEAVTSAQQNLKGMKFSGSFFHPIQLGTHMLMHLTLPFRLDPVNVNSPAVMDAMSHGLKMFEHEGLEGFSAGIGSSRWVNRIPAYGRLARRISELTFEHFLPAGKMALYEKILARNQQRFSTDPKGFRGELTEWMRKIPGLEKLRPKLSLDDIKTLSAVQANFAMGGQPWRAMAMSPEFTHALHLAFRAPDFLASRLGFVARAGTRLGAEERMALTIGALSLYSLGRLLNTSLSDDHDPHWKDPFDVFVGNRKYSIRTVIGDAVNMVKDPVKWWRNRLSPLLSSPIEFFSGVNWMGRPVSHGQAVRDAATEALPIPFTPRTDVKWHEQLMDAMGLHVTRHSTAGDVSKLAHDWMQKALPEKPPMKLPESPYLPLRQALADNDIPRAQKAYNQLLKTKDPDKIIDVMTKDRLFTGSLANEATFYSSLTDEQKKLYDRAEAEEKVIQERFLKIPHL